MSFYRKGVFFARLVSMTIEVHSYEIIQAAIAALKIRGNHCRTFRWMLWIDPGSWWTIAVVYWVISSLYGTCMYFYVIQTYVPTLHK